MYLLKSLLGEVSHVALSADLGGSPSSATSLDGDRSLRQSVPQTDDGTDAQGQQPGKVNRARGPPSSETIDDRDYWYALIDEKVAASHINVDPRTMQGLRQRGGGPTFIRISSRCIRYRRIDLRDWAEARMRSSTSDVG